MKMKRMNLSLFYKKVYYLVLFKELNLVIVTVFLEEKLHLAVTLFKFIPRCPYYDTFFAFRRTGVHPPLFN
jgi:hypothetical protein